MISGKWLLSAFPTPRAFAWWRPWYGGLHAVIYGPGLGEFPGPARLYEETFTAQEAMQTGHDGRIWRGLTVRSLLRGKGLRGLELAATYLTLPGSNLLAARVAVCNHTAAMLPVQAALVAYLQAGGTVDGAELLLDVAGRRRLLRAQRTQEVSADGWVGVRNPRTGRRWLAPVSPCTWGRATRKACWRSWRWRVTRTRHGPTACWPVRRSCRRRHEHR